MNRYKDIKYPILYLVSIGYCLLQTIIFCIDFFEIAYLKQFIIYNTIPTLLLLSISCYLNHNKKNNGIFIILYFDMIMFCIFCVKSVVSL